MTIDKNLNKLKEYIRNILFESVAELSSVKATNLLNIIKLHYPEKLNHYKNVIFKQSLNNAIIEFAKEVKTTPDKVGKVIEKSYNTKSGNPFGITGGNAKYKESNELIPDLIELSSYLEKANVIKNKLTDFLNNNPNIDKKEALTIRGYVQTLNKFFTQENFDLINQASIRLADRHNKQLELAKTDNLDGAVDPYTNIPIDFDNPTTIKVLGAYYQNKSNAEKAHNLHNPSGKISTALNKETIAGLRWLVNNVKLLR